MLRGVYARHAVHLLQIGHRPQPGERQEAAADAEVDDERWPGGRICQHACDAVIHGTCAVVGVDGLTAAKTSSSGRSRTRSQVAIASRPEKIANATNTERHEVCVTIQASGAPATTAPRLPANIVTPASVANLFGANQTAESLSTEMKATDTPMPTSVRPTAAISQAGANAKRSEPAAAIAEPASEELARPQRVGQHSDRNLQHRIDIEIGGGERAQHGAADVERARQFSGDGRRRGAMEEREHETRQRQPEHDATGARRARSVGGRSPVLWAGGARK